MTATPHTTILPIFSKWETDKTRRQDDDDENHRIIGLRNLAKPSAAQKCAGLARHIIATPDVIRIEFLNRAKTKSAAPGLDVTRPNS